MEKIKVIAFDADDTLWVNEPLFRDIEKSFCELMSEYGSADFISEELLNTERGNIALYGYGVKAFTLSLMETALRVSKNNLSGEVFSQIIDLGKSLLKAPVDILGGVEEVLKSLKGKYKLVVATKGDLVDQQRKIRISGLSDYFHHIEIMSEKNEREYKNILRHLDIEASEFLMIGNSLKSDVLPVLELGGAAFHIPFHTTWELEMIEEEIKHPRFKELKDIKEVLSFFS